MTLYTVQSDFCSFICFYLVCCLETEQHFLVCSLGHLAAEVMRPLAILSLSFENLKNVIFMENGFGQRIVWAEGDEPCLLGWVSLYTWVPGESNECSILEMLY